MKGFAILIKACWVIKKKHNLNNKKIAELLERLSKIYKEEGNNQ